MSLKDKQKLGIFGGVLLIMIFIIPLWAGAFPLDDVNPGTGHGPPGMKSPPMQRHHMSPYGIWNDKKAIQELNLSDEQIARLKEADFAFRETNLNLKAQMDNLHLQMEKAFSTDPVDESAILQTARKIAEVRGEIYVQEIKARLDFEKLLTEDQLKKLHMDSPQGPPPMGNMGPGMGNNPPPMGNMALGMGNNPRSMRQDFPPMGNFQDREMTPPMGGRDMPANQ